MEMGATSVLCETTEFLGAEHILARRAANKEVHDKIYKIVYDYEESLRRIGQEIRNGNPSPGNIAGGLTTLEENHWVAFIKVEKYDQCGIRLCRAAENR